MRPASRRCACCDGRRGDGAVEAEPDGAAVTDDAGLLQPGRCVAARFYAFRAAPDDAVRLCAWRGCDGWVRFYDSLAALYAYPDHDGWNLLCVAAHFCA